MVGYVLKGGGKLLKDGSKFFESQHSTQRFALVIHLAQLCSEKKLALWVTSQETGSLILPLLLSYSATWLLFLPCVILPVLLQAYRKHVLKGFSTSIKILVNIVIFEDIFFIP